MRDARIKQKEIARILAVNQSTISREISRNRRKYRKNKQIKNKNASYEAGVANHKAYVRRKYSKYAGKKIDDDDKLKQYITKKLALHWSPDEISGRMKKDKESFYASKTSIYEWLYTSRGSYWCQYLYHERYIPKRRKRKNAKKSLIPCRIGIAKRPSGANNKTRYGHWEGDTVVSPKKSGSRASLSVMYERKSKCVDVRRIPNLKPRSHNCAIFDMMKDKKVLSLTQDNGIENVKHLELGVKTYFCDPYSSWQKGGVENVIKMMRRFVPKRSDIANYSDWYVSMVVDILNNKPRKSLNYQTPYEVMAKHNLFVDNKKTPLGEIALQG
jgi:IS30 family transposase